MYVCVCHAVTDTEVATVIDQGARSVDAVTKACKAGGDCGACRGMIGEMIEDACDQSGPCLVPAASLNKRDRAA